MKIFNYATIVDINDNVITAAQDCLFIEFPQNTAYSNGLNSFNYCNSYFKPRCDLYLKIYNEEDIRQILMWQKKIRYNNHMLFNNIKEDVLVENVLFKNFFPDICERVNNYLKVKFYYDYVEDYAGRTLGDVLLEEI